MALTSLYERWMCASTRPGITARPAEVHRLRVAGARGVRRGQRPRVDDDVALDQERAPSRAAAPVPSMSRRFLR